MPAAQVPRLPLNLLAPLAPWPCHAELGAFYARRPPAGGRHLFIEEGRPVRGGARATDLVSLRVYTAA